MSDPNLPPRIPWLFLRWFCHPDYLPDIEGDLLQFYARRRIKVGNSRANWSFVRDVIRLFRPGLIRPIHISQKLNLNIMMDLFQHSLKISLRNFRKYRGSFLINLLGLSSGLACVLFIYLWVQDEVAVDQFHAHKDRLYQLHENVDQGGGMITRITTAGPTAAALAAEYPEVERAITTLPPERYTLSRGTNHLSGLGLYAGDGFFNLFTWDILAGNAQEMLSKPTNIVISSTLATSLFGDLQQAVGQTLELNRATSFQVSGVFRDISSTSSMKFDFVIPFARYWEDNEWVQNWYNTHPGTYLLLREGADLAAFNEKVKGLITEKTEGNAAHRSPFAALYTERYLYGHYENGIQSGGRIEYVRLFSAIALFILLIACINFMNLSTARASRRMKEIGVKKAVGSTRSLLIFQFLGESLLLITFSMAVALLLVWVLLPQFNLITNKSLALDFDLTLVTGSLVIMLGSGLIAGSYPAFYLSKFKPVTVLRGRLQTVTGEPWARKGLVTFQFTLSVILMVAVIVVYKQIRFTQSQNLGYDKENVLIMDIDGQLSDSLRFSRFYTELAQADGVLGVTGSHHDMTGHNGGTYGLHWMGKDPEDRTEFERMMVKPGFIPFMDISMKEGRSFNADLVTDYEDKIIFNEAAIAFIGMEAPAIGKKIMLWGREREIIGVTKDFNFESFHERVKPAFIILEDDAADMAMVKLQPGREQEAIRAIELLHSEMNPGFDLNFRFLDEDYQQMYEAENRVGTLSGYFATIAVIISCLGLFGLAAFSLERRSKEIGIRKVLGSTEWGLTRRLIYDLTKMVLIAVMIGLPISYLVAESWLEGFAFRIDLQAWFFGLAGMLTLVIALLTVGVQAVKAARLNPVQFLKDE